MSHRTLLRSPLFYSICVPFALFLHLPLTVDFAVFYCLFSFCVSLLFFCLSPLISTLQFPMSYPAPLGSGQGGYNAYPPAQYPNPQYPNPQYPAYGPPPPPGQAYGVPMQQGYGMPPPPPPGAYGSPYGAPAPPPPPPPQPQIIYVQQAAPAVRPQHQTIIVQDGCHNGRYYCRRCRTYHRDRYCPYGNNSGCGAQ